MKRDELHFRGVDWVELRELLSLVARRLFIADGFTEGGVLPGFGDDAEDLAHQLLHSFMDPDDNRLRWDGRKHGNPDTEGVFKYLCTALKHDFIDRRRSPRSKQTGDLSTVENRDLRHGSTLNPAGIETDSANEQGDEIVIRIHRSQILELILADLDKQPDEDLETYVLLQFETGEEYAAYKPQESAEKLGWDVSRVNSTKKRFERRLQRLLSEIESADLLASFPQKE